MCLWFILLGPLSAFFFPGGLISVDDISRLLVLWLPVGFNLGSIYRRSEEGRKEISGHLFITG